jgi:hypothetical protein
MHNEAVMGQGAYKHHHTPFKTTAKKKEHKEKPKIE